jgi:hypothetical protein
MAGRSRRESTVDPSSKSPSTAVTSKATSAAAAAGQATAAAPARSAAATTAVAIPAAATPTAAKPAASTPAASKPAAATTPSSARHCSRRQFSLARLRLCFTSVSHAAFFSGSRKHESERAIETQPRCAASRCDGLLCECIGECGSLRRRPP